MCHISFPTNFLLNCHPPSGAVPRLPVLRRRALPAAPAGGDRGAEAPDSAAAEGRRELGEPAAKQALRRRPLLLNVRD